jgi:lipoprotein-releasing system permease protein
LKGVDANYSKVNAIESKLYNGQWLQPNTYQVVVGYGSQKRTKTPTTFTMNNTQI